MIPQFANLNWPQRLQIVSSFNATNEQAANVMGVSVEELEQASKHYSPDATFNPQAYAPHFSTNTQKVAAPTSSGKKRRGRKTTKIKDAIDAITTTKQPLKDFCQRHTVSEHCMRQHSRFAPDRPDIVVRKDKESGQVMIWSDPEATVK